MIQIMNIHHPTVDITTPIPTLFHLFGTGASEVFIVKSRPLRSVVVMVVVLTRDPVDDVWIAVKVVVCVVIVTEVKWTAEVVEVEKEVGGDVACCNEVGNGEGVRIRGKVMLCIGSIEVMFTTDIALEPARLVYTNKPSANNRHPHYSFLFDIPSRQ
jgi:hypothetical protein